MRVDSRWSDDESRAALRAHLRIRMRPNALMTMPIRVGDRYVVEDPALRFGEFGLAMVLDHGFAVLSRSTR